MKVSEIVILCTAGLMFFLEPIQHAAEPVSDAAMPNTRHTPEYESHRKLQVYESAVQAAVHNGEIPAPQRPVLDSLIRSLGIDPAAARQLEQDALAATAG